MEGSGGGGLEDAAHFLDGIILGNLQGVSEALLLSSCVCGIKLSMRCNTTGMAHHIRAGQTRDKQG